MSEPILPRDGFLDPLMEAVKKALDGTNDARTLLLGYESPERYDEAYNKCEFSDSEDSKLAEALRAAWEAKHELRKAWKLLYNLRMKEGE